MARTVLRGADVFTFDARQPERADVAIGDGRIEAVGIIESLPGDRVHDASGMLVVPALTDIHTHIYWGGTSLGVKPEAVARRSGTGVFVDAGSAGAANFEGLKEFIFAPSPFHTFAYLNVSFPGIFGFSKRVMVGECEDARLLDVDACVEAAHRYPHEIVGIKVRAGRKAAGANGQLALETGLRVAETLGLPVMCHVDLSPPTIEEVMNQLRPGDIVTHCCRPDPNAPTRDGHVIEAAWRARERGVKFDIGHGMGGFSFRVCREMLADGFVPELISSDIHCLSVDGPAYDVLTTVNKLIALGVETEDALRAATQTPAATIGHPELGRIRVGDEANLALLKWSDEPWSFVDAESEHLPVTRRLTCEGLVVRGRAIDANGRPQPIENLGAET
jgi:dihydroorotase